MGELLITIGIGLFYCVSFLTAWALVEISYVVMQAWQHRRRMRAWVRRR